MKWNERIEFLPLNTTNAVPCPSRKPFWFLCECESASYVLKNTQRWGFTCINMTHLNSFLSGEQQRQMGAILLCLCGDGGGGMKKKCNAVSRGLFEIVGEYFASSSLPGCGWQQEHMIYSSYFVAACNSSVGVFVCCSDVMLPSSAPCKVHSCYILPLVEGMQMWSAKTLIAAF